MSRSIIKLFLPVSVLFFLLYPSQKAIPYENKGDIGSYGQLIQKYIEWLDLEGRVFKKMSFKLSLSQPIKDGYNAKIVLEDNLGSKWIFKPEFFKEDFLSSTIMRGSVLVYRFYELFGLQTPQIHYITLNINDKQVTGSIQEFIVNNGSLSGFTPDRISSSGLEYLLKAHVVDWMASNYDAGPHNFLILSLDKQGNPEKIMRIDNENALSLLDKDVLEYDWKFPGQEIPYTGYYYDFWRNYISKTIQLDIPKQYLFVKFISGLPDDFLKKIILLTDGYDLKQTPQYKISATDAKLLKFIILKKNNLAVDFKEFYLDLARKRNQDVSFNEGVSPRKIIADVAGKIEGEIKKLKKEERKLARLSSYPAKIDAVFSSEGFMCLKEVYRVYWQDGGKGGLDLACDAALKKLISLEALTDNQNEKRAIEIYAGEINKIRSGQTPSFVRNDINRFVADFVVPREKQEKTN